MSFEKLIASFKKMDKRVKYLIGAGVVLLLLAMFFPRSRSVGVKLVPVPGSSYYQAVFEGFSSDDKIESALSDNKPAFVAFVADWCGYCKKVKPQWQEFENNYKGNSVNVLSVECTKYKELGKKHEVSGYPTIKYLPNGLNNSSGGVDYEGERTPEGFSSFLSKYAKV
jgi:protein disulfide-isomerase-like protein